MKKLLFLLVVLIAIWCLSCSKEKQDDDSIITPDKAFIQIDGVDNDLMIRSRTNVIWVTVK